MAYAKGDVTPRTVTHPLGEIFVGSGWALTLARCRRVSCCRPLPPLPVTPVLFAATLLPTAGGPIPLARLGATPPSCRISTGRTAITALRVGGGEAPFTALQQAAARTTR
jgi:hypothetical protein